MADHAYDLVLRGGTVFDGTGAPGVLADVGIKDGLIAAIGPRLAAGGDEIDARGRIVTPGFVDIHTHYDGQATWGSQMSPSSGHGVTTVVMGNCGVGFAPCRPQDHDRLIRLMEGVEDIPFPVLTEGLPWAWESFPDYLDFLAGRSFDVDVAAQLPHAALRVYVMGERGANREPATPADIAAMADIARQAVEAGALGFSTSRTLNHRTSDGHPTPTLTAGEDELTGIALGLAAAGKGVLQLVSDFFPDGAAELAMVRRIVERSGRPLSFSLVQSPKSPGGWKAMLAGLSAAVDAGLPMKAQVCGRPVGVLFGLELTLNPFSQNPVFAEIKDKALRDKVAALSDPDFRARLLAHDLDATGPFAGSALRAWDNLFPMGADPDYEPTADATVAAIAAATGRPPAEVALDAMLENGGRGMLYHPFLNYADGSLDPSFRMLTHRDTVPGLSDGGAHVGMICDGSFPTSNLTHWTRDRARGPRIPLETMIARQTRDTAAAVGLLDRGLIAPGYRADLNVIDYEGLRLEAPRVAYDLPAGGRRLTQKAHGYAATLVAGVVTQRDGEPTGALPGRLVRGARSAPLALAAA
ncbi:MULTISPECIES: amidohydrolase family protein [Caulobacter]|jgi:N-acyl-D-aspartate/D-glutamate deacylase|uniref:Dihydroorotase n=1 Tax=Caulobacter vibrioides OR37 TaxID=1292034 RepID=R0E601_CAUVI|nr:MULTISPECIES: amidohydrolase family protein [Caulobacter]ENZ80993.1 dihydroorotase [Caulobacter vibrioides OR37]MBQ1559376.1 amidohydrolase family protein [Caulobacter sp.]